MKYTAIFITFLSLSACSSFSIQQTHVSITGESDTKTFQYRDKTISDDYIIKSLAKQMLEHSQYPKNKVQNNKVFIIKGIEAYLRPGEIMLTYFNGSQHIDTGTVYGTKINIPFTYQFSSDENTKVLTLTPPKFFDVIPGRNILMLPFDPLLTNEQVFEDIKNIYQEISPNLYLNSNISGEFNSPYPVKSIQYNFARILGHVSRSSAYNNIFRLPFKNSYIPVAVKFFPYKNGSKISYSFDYPYQENTDSTSTYNEQEVAQLKSIIFGVVND
jgi:hypothetical protein